MAAVKEFIYEAAEYAFKREAGLISSSDFATYRVGILRNYGEETANMVMDIYDEIADRSGDAWDMFSSGEDWDTLIGYYTKTKTD